MILLNKGTCVTLNSLLTDKPVALGSQIELEFRSVGFWGGRKTKEPGETPSEEGWQPTTNSTHTTLGPGFEPGPHWWEESALTTAPSLLPTLMSRYCFLNTSYMTGLFVIFILLHIWQNYVCFGELLSMRTLCDAYHEERASHLRSILDISPSPTIWSQSTYWLNFSKCTNCVTIE